MPYDPGLAHYLAELTENHPQLESKKMFGGIGYLLNGNMCVGIYKGYLVLRVGLPQAEMLLKKPHIKPFDITGKVMKGWVMVAPDGYEDETTTKQYLKHAIDFVTTLEPKPVS